VGGDAGYVVVELVAVVLLVGDIPGRFFFCGLIWEEMGYSVLGLGWALDGDMLGLRVGNFVWPERLIVGLTSLTTVLWSLRSGLGTH
jgi:hypothetical protein